MFFADSLQSSRCVPPSLPSFLRDCSPSIVRSLHPAIRLTVSQSSHDEEVQPVSKLISTVAGSDGQEPGAFVT